MFCLKNNIRMGSESSRSVLPESNERGQSSPSSLAQTTDVKGASATVNTTTTTITATCSSSNSNSSSEAGTSTSAPLSTPRVDPQRQRDESMARVRVDEQDLSSSSTACTGSMLEVYSEEELATGSPSLPSSRSSPIIWDGDNKLVEQAATQGNTVDIEMKESMSLNSNDCCNNFSELSYSTSSNTIDPPRKEQRQQDQDVLEVALNEMLEKLWKRAKIQRQRHAHEKYYKSYVQVEVAVLQQDTLRELQNMLSESQIWKRILTRKEVLAEFSRLLRTENCTPRSLSTTATIAPESVFMQQSSSFASDVVSGTSGSKGITDRSITCARKASSLLCAFDDWESEIAHLLYIGESPLKIQEQLDALNMGYKLTKPFTPPQGGRSKGGIYLILEDAREKFVQEFWNGDESSLEESLCGSIRKEVLGE